MASITAEKFNKKPADSYRKADKGETVVINHDRFPDRVFELTARDRRKDNHSAEDLCPHGDKGFICAWCEMGINEKTTSKKMQSLINERAAEICRDEDFWERRGNE